jgi:hypothetical protein
MVANPQSREAGAMFIVQPACNVTVRLTFGSGVLIIRADRLGLQQNFLKDR